VLNKIAHLPTRSVRYLEAGIGRPLILLHAFPLSADQWLPQLHRVPIGWRYIAPDLRGFRGTGPAFEDVVHGVTVDTYAADVVELMAHLEIPTAVVAGLSMGGYVAMALARRAPARLSGLVLANTRATADSPEARAGRDRAIELVQTYGPIGLGLEMLPKLLGVTTQRDQPDLADAVRRVIEMNAPDTIVSALVALRDRPDATVALAALVCPATVIHGEEDAIVSHAESEALQAAIPGARLVVLPRAGHLSNLEAPIAFLAALAEIPPEPSAGDTPLV
jgi:pimeloyl-ACP methyl ester carboxylesterase